MEDAQKPDGPERLGGVVLELVPLASHAERWALTFAMGDAEGRTEMTILVFAAALGLSWPALRRYLAQDRIRFRGDVLEFGQQVVDYLATRPAVEATPTAPARGPVPINQISSAGRRAYTMARESLISEPAVKAAEGFSTAPSASSRSSSSTSSTTGAGIQDGSAPSTPSPPLA